MPRAVTPEGFAEHAAQRLSVHNATADGNTRGGIRAKLRELAKRLGVAPPTWALAVERRSAATARENRGGRKARFGVRASALPRSKRETCGNGLAVIARGESARPLELPAALVAWRLRTEGACVQLHGDGRVTLLAPESLASATYVRRTFVDVEAAVRAVA